MLSIWANTIDRKYLSDPTEDVRVATENLLAEILREIQYVATVQKRSKEKQRLQQIADADRTPNTPSVGEKLPEITMSHPERAAFLPEGNLGNLEFDNEEAIVKDSSAEPEYRDTGGMNYELFYWDKTVFLFFSVYPWSRRYG